MTSKKLLIRTLQGEVTERVPFWFMRQAGRFLPEYRELRASTKGFLDLCYTPHKAAEVTLQPLKRFNMDAAILFSDILVIPHALGVDVRFAEGEGPIVEIVNTKERIKQLSYDPNHLKPIGETVKLVKKDLPEGAALIGFAGSPWTVACYLLREGKDKEFNGARKFAITQPQLMQALIDKLVDATIQYLSMQIECGAEAVQLFDSWAGVLTPDQFIKWSIEPTKKIVASLRSAYPHIPIIGFARGAGTNLKNYAKETEVNCIGADMQTPMEFAVAARAHEKQAVQGNLDPLLVVGDANAMLAQTQKILAHTKSVPHVFNFGHGMQPETPIENVAALCQFLKEYRL
jgi:uroporphyrinogen decarboxylase